MPLCCLVALAVWLASRAGASAQPVAAPRVHPGPRQDAQQQQLVSAPRIAAARAATQPAALQAAGACTLSAWGAWSSCAAARSFPRPPRAAVQAWTLPASRSDEAYQSLARVCAGDGCLFLPDQRAPSDDDGGADSSPDDIAPPLPRLQPSVPQGTPDAVSDSVPLRRCATRAVSGDEARAVAAASQSADKAPDASGGIFVRLVWTVVHDGAVGNLSRAAIEAQVAHLNAAWAGAPQGSDANVTWWRPDAPHATGVIFTLKQVIYRDDAAFFASCNPDTGPTKSTAWNVDTAHSMNVYSCLPTDDLLGWTVFPWDTSGESDGISAVFVRHDTLPGSGGKYGLGNTLVHEAGHYFGLLHVFEGTSCSGDGDGVADTAQQAKPTYGSCAANAAKATCPPPLDNIVNYMDYSDDSCMRAFSEGQVRLIRATAKKYRPSVRAPRKNTVFPSAEAACTRRSCLKMRRRVCRRAGARDASPPASRAPPRPCFLRRSAAERKKVALSLRVICSTSVSCLMARCSVPSCHQRHQLLSTARHSPRGGAPQTAAGGAHTDRW